MNQNRNIPKNLNQTSNVSPAKTKLPLCVFKPQKYSEIMNFSDNNKDQQIKGVARGGHGVPMTP